MSALTSWKLPLACGTLVVGLPLALTLIAHSRGASTPAAVSTPMAALPHEVTSTLAAAYGGAAANRPKGFEISLGDAIGRRWLQVTYHGNGHDELRASFINRRNDLLRVSVAGGMIFETADMKSELAIARTQVVDLPPGERREAHLSAAATRSANLGTWQPYQPCPATLPALADLFAEADRSPEFSIAAIQTAVLLLTENAPLDLFAKFTLLSGEPSARSVPSTFHVDTVEILSAFQLLRAAGYSRLNMPAAHEPQLKIEAMIDPLAHSAALQYYKISGNQEWAYWRDELEKGDLSTRHYALYGIGRNYPEIALEMLPAWARATNLSPLFRTSAIQAMAETRRPEAISILQELASEFGGATELGQSARKAIAYLENERDSAAPAGGPVEFRLSDATFR